MILEHHDQLVEQNSHLLEENQRLHKQLDELEAEGRALAQDLVRIGSSLSEALERLRVHLASH